MSQGALQLPHALVLPYATVEKGWRQITMSGDMSLSKSSLPAWLLKEVKDNFSFQSIDDIVAGARDLEVIVSLQDHITSKYDFETMLTVLNDNDDVGEKRDKIYRAYDQYILQALRSYLETKEKYSCAICGNADKIPEDDVCALCRKQYFYEAQKIRTQLYRARKEGTPATLTLGQWMKTLQRYNSMCAYCQENTYDVIEHSIPITKGGGTTEENCVPACFSCNSKKGGRLL